MFSAEKKYGAKKEENEWKIWNNQELRNIYGQPNIISEIKSKRLEWLDMWQEWKRIQWLKEYLKETLVGGERLVDPGTDGWTAMRRILDW
jgi:hypothetical protein